MKMWKNRDSSSLPMYFLNIVFLVALLAATMYAEDPGGKKQLLIKQYKQQNHQKQLQFEEEEGEGRRDEAATTHLVAYVGKLMEVVLASGEDNHLLFVQNLPPWLLCNEEERTVMGVPTLQDLGFTTFTVTLLCGSADDTSCQSTIHLVDVMVMLLPTSLIHQQSFTESSFTTSSAVQKHNIPLLIHSDVDFKDSPAFSSSSQERTDAFSNSSSESSLPEVRSDQVEPEESHVGLTVDKSAGSLPVPQAEEPASATLHQDRCANHHVASLVLCSTPDKIDSAQRVRIIQQTAEFLSVPPRTLTWQTSSDSRLLFLDKGYRVESGGASDHAQCAEDVHSELFWPLSCSVGRHVQEFSRILQHNVQVGRIQREVGVEIVGWYVAVGVSSSGGRKRRRRRRVGRTPIPTPTLYPPTASAASSSSLSEVDFTAVQTAFPSSNRRGLEPTATLADLQTALFPPAVTKSHTDSISTGVDLDGDYPFAESSTEVYKHSSVVLEPSIHMSGSTTSSVSVDSDKPTPTLSFTSTPGLSAAKPASPSSVQGRKPFQEATPTSTSSSSETKMGITKSVEVLSSFGQKLTAQPSEHPSGIDTAPPGTRSSSSDLDKATVSYPQFSILTTPSVSVENVLPVIPVDVVQSGVERSRTVERLASVSISTSSVSRAPGYQGTDDKERVSASSLYTADKMSGPVVSRTIAPGLSVTYSSVLQPSVSLTQDENSLSSTTVLNDTNAIHQTTTVLHVAVDTDENKGESVTVPDNTVIDARPSVYGKQSHSTLASPLPTATSSADISPASSFMSNPSVDTGPDSDAELYTRHYMQPTESSPVTISLEKSSSMSESHVKLRSEAVEVDAAVSDGMKLCDASKTCRTVASSQTATYDIASPTSSENSGNVFEGTSKSAPHTLMPTSSANRPAVSTVDYPSSTESPDLSSTVPSTTQTATTAEDPSTKSTASTIYSAPATTSTSRTHPMTPSQPTSSTTTATTSTSWTSSTESPFRTNTTGPWWWTWRFTTTSRWRVPQPVTTVPVRIDTPNNPPFLVNSISYMTAKLGCYFERQIPDNMFYDVEDGSTRALTLTLTLPYDQTLPSNFWVQFDAGRQMLLGLPLVADLDMGYHRVVIVATDSQGLGARNPISLYVNSSAFVRFTHRFVMKFGVEFGQFMHRRDNMMRLMKRIGSYFGDDSAQYVTVVDVSMGSLILSWTNSSLSGPFCQNDTVQYLLARMVRRNGSVRSAFKRHVGRKLQLQRVAYQPDGACLYRTPPLPPTDPTTSTTATTTTTTATLDTSARKAAGSDLLTEIILPVLIALLLLLLVVIVVLFVYRCRQQRGLMETLDKDLCAMDRRPVILPNDVANVRPHNARPKHRKPVNAYDAESRSRSGSGSFPRSRSHTYDHYRLSGSLSRDRPNSYTFDDELSDHHRPVTVIFNNFDSASRQSRPPSYWNDLSEETSPRVPPPYFSTTSV